MRISSRLLIAALAILGALAAPARASGDPQIFFERTQGRLTAIAAAPAGARQRACEALVRDAFDAISLARSVASAGHWSVMQAETRQLLTDAVAGRLARECAALVDRANPALARVGRIREVPGGVRLTVLIPDDRGEERVVVWSLRTGGRLGWTATDLSIDGRAAAASFRQDFEAALTARPGPVSSAVAYFAAMGTK